MNIKAIRSDAIYRRMAGASKEEKDNIYRYELMEPFAFKWNCMGIPLKAEKEGGCDVISAGIMSGGYSPSQITEAAFPKSKGSAMMPSGKAVKTAYKLPFPALNNMELSCLCRIIFLPSY